MPAIVHPAGEVVISMRPVSVFANGPECELEQLRGDLHGRWRQATRAVMVLLSLHGLPPSQIAALLDCHPVTVRRWISRFSSEGAAGLAEDETHLNLLPHVRASWTPRGARPQIPTPGKNRQVTVFGAIEVSSGRWVCRLGRRCAADFIALLGMLAEAFPHAPVIVVICDNDSVHHARAVTRYLQEHRRLEVLYGARYSPHDNPAERIWAALKNYVANTAVSWPGRLRQIHSFFRARSPESDAGHRRALDQPVAAAGLRAELLECRFRHRGERSPRVRGRRVRYRHLEVHGHQLFGQRQFRCPCR